MPSGLCCPEPQNDYREQHRRKKQHGASHGGLDGVLSLTTNVAAARYYPFPHLPTWDLSMPSNIWFSPHITTTECSTRRCKRSREEPTAAVGGGAAAQDGFPGKPPGDSPPRKLKWDELKSLYAHGIWNCDDVCVAIEDEGSGGGGGGCGDGHGGADDGTMLVQQLIACAEAVACRDHAHAESLLAGLCTVVPVHGAPFQRVASCFFRGLADRLLLAQPPSNGGAPAAPRWFALGSPAAALPDEREEGIRLAYELCPYIQFGHMVANSAIMEAFEGESSVHVVDLGMSMGLLPAAHQWRQLLHDLAARPGAPPRRVRITGVGGDGDTMAAVGRELQEHAEGLGLRLEFSAVDGSLENLTPASFGVAEGEALAVSSVFHLHRVVKESRGALNAALRAVHGLRPRVLALVEQDAGHNGPFFLGRFMEALHYYAAVFDALDAALPRYDTRRARVEQFHFGEEIRNIVSCEGPARVERHERLDQWRRRMSRAGFQQAPVRMVAQARRWLAETGASCEGYTAAEEKGCLVLGWKGKPLVAASCWKC